MAYNQWLVTLIDSGFSFLVVYKITVCLTIDGSLYLMKYGMHGQPFLQDALVLFSGEWYLESKIWVLGALHGVRVSLPGPLSKQLCIYAQMYIHRYTHVHTYMYIHIYFYIYS